MPTAKAGFLHSCKKGCPNCQARTIAMSVFMNGGREGGERKEGKKEGLQVDKIC